MGTLDQKRDIFSEIGACRAVSEGFPELQLSDSFPSISVKKDAIAFLVNVLKSLIGYEQIRDKIVEIVSKQTEDLEEKIKFALKKALKEYVNCNVDPTIPDVLESTGNGYTFKVSDIDFTDSLKIDPKSEVGKLFYIDRNAGVNSEDLNTFLYAAIQTGNQETWNSNTGIMDVKFNQNSTPSNTLTINANSNYDGETLTNFNNDLLDSIDLFNTEKLLTKIFDSVFGVASLEIGLTLGQNQKEEKVKDIVEKISASEDDETIDDSFFNFSPEEVEDQERRAKNRSNGILEIISCNNAQSSVSFDTVSEMHDNVSTAKTTIEKTKEIEDKIEELGQQSASNVDDKDKLTVEFNLLDEIIQKLHVSIVNLILSPKVLLIFAINYRIINGPNATFNGLDDFIEKNRSMIEDVVKTVRDEIVKELMNEVLKQISQLLQAKIQAILTEKVNNQKAQLASLIGIPQEIIRQINDLG